MRAKELYEKSMFPASYSHWNTMIYENPSLSTLRALAHRMDIRGLVDGENLFVWDAGAMIHGFAANAIAASDRWKGAMKGYDWHINQYGYDEPVYNTSWCCYFFDPENLKNHKDGGEWASSPNARSLGIDHYAIAPNLVIAVPARGVDELMRVPAFSRVFRNAKLISSGRH